MTAGESHTTTDAAGHYQFLTLPAATYDVTASKYGYLPSTATGVSVTAGATTVQDFTLESAPSRPRRRNSQGRLRSGLAAVREARRFRPDRIPRDDSLQRSGDGLLLHPAFRGLTYDFAVTSLVPGYEPGGGPLAVGGPLSAPNAAVANWTLAVSPTCTAPGIRRRRFRRTARALGELRRGCPSRGLVGGHAFGCELEGLHGRRALLHRERHRWLRTVRDGQQRLRGAGRHLPRDADDGSLGPHERGHPVGQRLHHRSIRAVRRERGREQRRRSRAGRTCGRGRATCPARATRSPTCPSPPDTPTSRCASTIRASSPGRGRWTT